ncbi:hypothetical protein ABT299_11655 [Spirillospora sp. NPDC000708]|uniref:Uncharacterized protein n=1 Tax=Actinomadura violacea TaxID=2819934 RepID=A0ABS3RWV4_9ACTN|nr:hypothetical protein [Actinomadura violacea]MBO2461121.1 hypothetical protein [Actinomadura violacea]
MELTPEQRRDRARQAVQVSWQKTEDPAARTEPARAAALKRFENQVDPDRVLPEDERLRRANEAKRQFYKRLGKLSAAARRARREATRAAL